MGIEVVVLMVDDPLFRHVDIAKGAPGQSLLLAWAVDAADDPLHLRLRLLRLAFEALGVELVEHEEEHQVTSRNLGPPEVEVLAGAVVEAGRRDSVVRPESGLLDSQGSLVQGTSAREVALCLEEQSEVV